MYWRPISEADASARITVRGVAVGIPGDPGEDGDVQQFCEAVPRWSSWTSSATSCIVLLEKQNEWLHMPQAQRASATTFETGTIQSIRDRRIGAAEQAFGRRSETDLKQSLRNLSLA